MTLPAYLFGLMSALLIGALFHLLVDGGSGRLVLFLFLSAAGFAVGHLLGSSWHWTFIPVGPLAFGPAALGSVLFLAVGYWLSMMQV